MGDRCDIRKRRLLVKIKMRADRTEESSFFKIRMRIEVPVLAAGVARFFRGTWPERKVENVEIRNNKNRRLYKSSITIIKSFI